MRGGLEGLRVLVTRPGEIGRELAITLAAAGAEGRWAPAIDFVAAEPEELEGARAAARAADALIVSSPRALDLLLPEGETPPRGLLHVVGAATAARARARGARVGLVDDGGVDGLVERLVAEGGWEGRRVFRACGNLSESARVDPLRAAGARVDEQVLYRTVDVYAREGFATELLDGLQAAVVASPSAVDALAGALNRCGRSELFSVLRFAAIGPTTAAALKRRGAARIKVAKEPGNAGLLDCLRRT